jgi:hypothetical protein
MLLATRALGLGASILFLQFAKAAEGHARIAARLPFVCSAADRPWVGLGQSAAYRSLMWFTKIDGVSVTGICSDLVAFTRRCLSGRTDRLASVILNVRGRS